MENTDVSQILAEAEKYVANLDAILKEEAEMNHATEFLINEYKTNKRYFCSEGSRPSIDDVIKTCVEFAWASSRNYHNDTKK